MARKYTLYIDESGDFRENSTSDWEIENSQGALSQLFGLLIPTESPCKSADFLLSELRKEKNLDFNHAVNLPKTDKQHALEFVLKKTEG